MESMYFEPGHFEDNKEGILEDKIRISLGMVEAFIICAGCLGGDLTHEIYEGDEDWLTQRIVDDFTEWKEVEGLMYCPNCIESRFGAENNKPDYQEWLDLIDSFSEHFNEAFIRYEDGG